MVEVIAPPEIEPEEPEPETADLPDDSADESGKVPTGDVPREPTEEPVATAAPAEPPRRRRLRIALLLFLVGAAGMLLIFSGWYLLFRKPVSEFPLPGITAERMPDYSYSLYGVWGPMGIAVSDDGSRIYVTQTEVETAVIVFDGRGNELTRLAPPETGTDHVFVYVAIDPLSGDIYVSDRLGTAIQIYAPDGTYKLWLLDPLKAPRAVPAGATATIKVAVPDYKDVELAAAGDHADHADHLEGKGAPLPAGDEHPAAVATLKAGTQIETARFTLPLEPEGHAHP